MRYGITYNSLAQDDLDALRAWIETEADFDTARRYVARVIERIENLTYFPNRGSPHDDMGAGVRSLSFESRLLVFYEVGPNMVTILRVVSSARNIRSLSEP